MREPQDIADLVAGAARELAAQNVRYVELTVTPYSHAVGMGMPAAAVTAALDVAARQVADRIQVTYVFGFPGEFGAGAARATIGHALAHPPERLADSGVAGIEQGRAGHEKPIRAAFRAAVRAGLHSVPHAGEVTGPETIWEAVHELGAERIGHGIRCLEDPDLIACLREKQIPLGVCPTSNVCTRQVAGIVAHPLPRLLDEGLYVTLNSDDPCMFNTTLNGKYRTVATQLGLGPGPARRTGRDERTSIVPQRGPQADDPRRDRVSAAQPTTAITPTRSGMRAWPAPRARPPPSRPAHDPLTAPPPHP